MLGDISRVDHIYLACGYTDLRRGIDGLAQIVQQQFELDPFPNSLFLFCGKRRDRIKALLWEGNSFVLLYKRMENGGGFQWHRSCAEMRSLSWNTKKTPPEPFKKDQRGVHKIREASHWKLTSSNETEDRIYALDEEERICPSCKGKLVWIEKELVREVFEYQRPKLKLVRYWQMSYKFPACHKKGRSVIVRASVSKVSAESQSGRSFDGSRNHVSEVCECHAAVPAGSSMETAGGDIQPDHYGALDHPVRRRLAGASVGWDAMRKELVQREVLHADETVVQVLKENSKTSQQSKSYIWVYRTGMDGLPPIVLYDYQPGRSGEYPNKFLEGFHGYLHTDGYAGYNQVQILLTAAAGPICAGSSWRPCLPHPAIPKICSRRHRLRRYINSVFRASEEGYSFNYRLRDRSGRLIWVTST